MEEPAGLIPSNIGVRLLWGAGSGLAAATYFGFFGHGALEWNTLTYWLFVGGVSVLGAAMHGMID